MLSEHTPLLVNDITFLNLFRNPIREKSLGSYRLQ